ncbi:M15 family metallopeptidase [Arthrobacter sp. MA-N2]|uniref:M15 family metallopeptidase n=1 Tax=Arthrobacter sp. MA-N2 TaxID=1101188 RepID=UPI0018CC4954|nr:M15 family metallopeptidase [Arthrobacter sp. MA-N2]
MKTSVPEGVGRRFPWVLSVLALVLPLIGLGAIAGCATPFAGHVYVSPTSGASPIDVSPKPASQPFSAQDDIRLRDGQIDPLDNNHPAVRGLKPELRAAVQRAALAAKSAGHEQFWLTSGWRSPSYQQELLDAGIAKYGSREEAAKWVSTPQKSKHVTGEAVDIGPTNAADYVNRHSGELGLCQTYANEIWHFELRPAGASACPAPLVNAAG